LKTRLKPLRSPNPQAQAIEAIGRPAALMADSRIPWGVEATSTAITNPAWRSKPAWYLVSGDGHMIPTPTERVMAERIGAQTVEVPGASHAVYVSHPAAVADLIKQAAAG
jgi:pimeloyl-ACP methyl ester carboxylesterase